MNTQRAGIGAAGLLAIAVVALASACGTARLGETTAGVPRMGESAVRGELVFMQHCNKCHPDGEAALGPAINGKPLPGWLMRIQIRTGLGVMPAFDEQRITAEQLDDLIDYLQLR